MPCSLFAWKVLQFKHHIIQAQTASRANTALGSIKSTKNCRIEHKMHMEETKKTRTRPPKVFPHVFVWGSCFWFCTPACFLPLPAACHTQLAHTQLVHTPLTHTQLVHIQLAHTLLAPTQFVYKQLTHTQLVNTQLAHTQLVHTPLTHTQLPHTHTHTTSSLATSTFTLRGTYGTGLALVARLGPS